MTVLIQDLAGPVIRPRRTVIVFPHAGGSPRYFSPLARSLPAGIAMYGITYPGRDALGGVAAPPYLTDLARDCAAAIRPLIDAGPVVLLGHSMGGYIAFEAARDVERSGRTISQLVVSGADAPPARAAGSWHHASDSDLARHLGRFDSRTAQALSQPSLRRLLLPVIRSDYRLVEGYRAAADDTVHCPLTVISGTTDPEVDLGNLPMWKCHTSAEFRLRTYCGGHFSFITDPALTRSYLELVTTDVRQPGTRADP
ncbi:thioesterase [Nocardia sp. BSTN01]|uniref:thioesterase II family protein n=1 Tax=Nocardia sp. BSTN01 TaxID=2783665 RepID=UPI00188FEA8E|nr:alpha/beta fold hydrolase [Nocardia sp. BSTN01]MBF4998067.1 thioesterase [Nocardia sp. BSTN01]